MKIRRLKYPLSWGPTYVRLYDLIKLLDVCIEAAKTKPTPEARGAAIALEEIRTELARYKDWD